MLEFNVRPLALSRWVDTPDDEARSDPGMDQAALNAWERLGSDDPAQIDWDTPLPWDLLAEIQYEWTEWQPATPEPEGPIVTVNGMPLQAWLVMDELDLNSWQRDDTIQQLAWAAQYAEHLFDPDDVQVDAHGSTIHQRSPKGYIETHGTHVSWGPTTPVRHWRTSLWLDLQSDSLGDWVWDVTHQNQVWSAGGQRAWYGHGRRAVHSNLRAHEADRLRQRKLVRLEAASLHWPVREPDAPLHERHIEKPRGISARQTMRWTGKRLYQAFLIADHYDFPVRDALRASDWLLDEYARKVERLAA